MIFNFESTQTYTYTDKQSLEKIHQEDRITFATYIEEENIVQYTMDRKKYVRLSDLVYWIKSNFVSFHFGQLLFLFKKLIEKVKLIQKHISHDYLSLDRIWLELNHGAPNIIYQNIDYHIIFTGYRCAIFEQGQILNDEQQISLLIGKILKSCINSIILVNKAEFEQNTIKPLIELCASPSCEINFLYRQIISLLEINKYNQDTQTIMQDDNTYNPSRQKIISKVNENLQFIISLYKQDSQIILELALHQAIPRLVKEINSYMFYSKVELNFQSIKEKYDQLSENIIKLLDEQQKIINDFIKSEIERNNKRIHFEANPEEINKNIYEKGKFLIFSYISNSVWILATNDNILPLINILISKYSIPMANRALNQLLLKDAYDFLQELI